MLPALEFLKIANRLQNPAAQPSATHWSHGAIECREQTHVSRSAGTDKLQIRLCGCVQQDMIGRSIATERSEVIDFPAQLVLQIMNNGARRGNRLRQVRTSEAVERFYLEVLAEGEAGVLGHERVVIVGQGTGPFTEIPGLLVADEQFRRCDARKLVEKAARFRNLHEPKLACAQVRIGKAVNSIFVEDRSEVIGTLRFQQIEIAHGAGANDLRDIPVDDLALLRFARLVADRDAAAGLDQLGDVTRRGVIRHAAHRDFVALG